MSAPVAEAYLDHAATTPVREEALEAMLPYLRDVFGNPSGAHRPARAARKAIDDAREVVAEAVGAEPAEVVFTSGGTEADNLAVLGVHDRVGGVVVCSAVEHHAVLDPVESRRGRIVGVGADGVIDLGQLEAALDDEVSLVSVMAVNNEVGTIQPIDRVAELVRARAPGALVHTDAVQAAPWFDLGPFVAPADLVSISAHKLGGPKGAGALVVRAGATPSVAPRVIGGGQERERRSGTPNVPAIVGMAEALRLTVAERAAEVVRVRDLRDQLADGLRACVPGAVETGVPVDAAGRADRSGRAPGSCHVCFDGVESEALLFLLEEHGVYASAGSSCASGAMEPSHVLTAMGVPRRLAFGSVRFSLGHASAQSDVALALAVVPGAVARLREFAA